MASGRTPEKCVNETFFENLFLGALLAFLCSICTRRKKKTPTFGGEEGHEGQREGQEFNNRMCSNNLNSETPT
jgi:hypothetical protein